MFFIRGSQSGIKAWPPPPRLADSGPLPSPCTTRSPLDKQLPRRAQTTSTAAARQRQHNIRLGHAANLDTTVMATKPSFNQPATPSGDHSAGGDS